MKKVLYAIHGFASSGNSNKINGIREAFPDLVVIAPDYTLDPMRNFQQFHSDIQSILASGVDQLVIMGTSLGGLYAKILSDFYDTEVILINPLVYPSSSSIVAGTYVNHDTGDLFDVSQTQINSLHALECEVDTDQVERVHLFVSENDNVIDHRKTLDAYKFARSITVDPNGGHRFTNMSVVHRTIQEIFNL